MAKHLEAVLYVEDGWSAEKIVGILKDHRSVKKYAIMLHDKDQKEDGTPDKPHYHVYANYGKTNVSIKHFAAWFNIRQENIQKINKGSSMYNVIQYYLHIDELDKHQYPISDIVANFDVEAFLEKCNSALDLEDIISRIELGEITRINYHQFIDAYCYAKNKHQIENAFEYVDDLIMSQTNGDRDCTSYWFSGHSRVGKSTLAKLFARQLGFSIYTSSEGTDPFGEYKGQECVILNDVRPDNMDFMKLINVIDPHVDSKIGSRYHNKFLRCRLIIITSTMTANQYASEFPKEESKQLFGRLKEEWFITADKVKAYTFDNNFGCFKYSWDMDNPVPQYLKSLPTKADINGKSVLSGINEEYNLKVDGIQVEQELILIPQLDDDIDF